MNHIHNANADANKQLARIASPQITPLELLSKYSFPQVKPLAVNGNAYPPVAGMPDYSS